MQIAFSCMRAVPRCERHRIVAVFFCLLQSVLLCTTITKQLYLENKTKKKTATLQIQHTQIGLEGVTAFRCVL